MAGSLLWVTPLPAFAQSTGACAVITKADMTALIGADAKATPIGDEQCNIEGKAGGYEVYVKRKNVANEMKDWHQFSMPKPSPLKDMGDEAYVSSMGNVIIARKGAAAAIRVSASGVMPSAPMPYKQGVPELTKRILANLK